MSYQGCLSCISSQLLSRWARSLAVNDGLQVVIINLPCVFNLLHHVLQVTVEASQLGVVPLFGINRTAHFPQVLLQLDVPVVVLHKHVLL